MSSSFRRSHTGESPFTTYETNTKLTFVATTPDNLSGQEFDVRFDFTKDAKFDTMPHFHVDKTEYLYVQRGAVRLRLGNEIRMIDQSVGEVKIARWTPHRWEVLGEAETTVFERTEPRDGRKQGFFRNFVSLCNDYGGLDKIPPLQVFKTFAEWDNYPIGNAAWMASMRSAIVGITWAVGGIAGLCGYRAVYKEYMPPDLYEKLK